MKASRTSSDANGRCRLCLGDDVSSRAIFAEGTAFERLRSLILDCCPITLFDDDRLPSSICYRCENKLDLTYRFRQLCRESERALRARHESCFRGRSDSVRADGARTTDADQRIETSKEPGNGCPRSPTRERTEPNSGWKNTERYAANNLEIVGGGGGGGGGGGRSATEKRKELSDFRSERKEEEEEEKFEQRKSKEPEEGDRFPRNGSEFANETFFPAGDGVETNGGTSATRKKFVCDACSKTFASKSGLRFHSKSHVGEKPHPCRHCGKRFAIPSYAKRHERIHATEKQFICHVCSAPFASSNGLRYHLRSHTGEANYRCETCGKSFRRYKYLKEHVFTHTGEKPFVCKSCGVSYASSGSLFVHEKKCGRETARPASSANRPLDPVSPSVDRSRKFTQGRK